MVKLLILVGLIGLLTSLVIRSGIKARRRTNALNLHNDMFSKYIELAEDPFMNEHKWKEWLPIFEEADKIYARDCPNMKFFSIAQIIKNIINNEESIQE